MPSAPSATWKENHGFRRSVRRQLKFIQINAQLTGDNIIIPARQAGVKENLEVVKRRRASYTSRARPATIRLRCCA